MKQLQNHALFEGLSAMEYQTLTQTFQVKFFSKGEILFRIGEIIDDVYLILQGALEICSYDLHGNKKLVTVLAAQEMFAESIAWRKENRTPFDLIAVKELVVVQISKAAIIQGHPQVLQNFVTLLATKNTFLTHKIECLNKMTIRERLYEVFTFYGMQQRSAVITLPFNKTQLADYLCVSRSRLSKELHRMEAEGMFTVHKQTYHCNENFFKTLQWTQPKS